DQIRNSRAVAESTHAAISRHACVCRFPSRRMSSWEAPPMLIGQSNERPRRLRRLGLCGMVLIAMTVAVAARWQQEAPPITSFRIVAGLKDKEPAEWSGKIDVAGGEVASLTGWRFEDADA